MTVGEMRALVKQGARFVVFEYVTSFLIYTKRHASPTFFIRPGESTFAMSLPYNLITLLLGWWSIPFGPGFTIGALRDNLRGGHDVTDKTIAVILDAADRQAKNKPSRR